MNFFVNQIALATRRPGIVFFVIAMFFCPKAIHATEVENDITIEQEPVTTFWDRYQESISETINKPVIWFDNFFGDPRIEDEDLAESFVRLRNAVRFTEGEEVTYPIRLRANIKLPRASRRLRLIITGENEEDLRVAQTNSTAVPGLTPQQPDDTTNLGLRYSIYTTLRSTLHFGGGVRLQNPLEYYLRLRYRRLIHIGSRNIFRFTETGFWHSLDKFGETSRLDFERSLSKTLSNRISTFGTYSEVSEGVDWGVEESLFKQLSPKSAISLDLGAYGDTRPHTEINNYRIGSRFRKNILRPWLFFEIEPEVNFPLDIDGKRRAVGAVTFIFEIQFASEKLDID